MSEQQAVGVKVRLNGIPSRGLRSAKELAESKPHGDRVRYMGGCRCSDCRRANAAYEKERAVARKAGDWNGLVDTARSRAHLAELSRLGVGRHSVAAASDVSDSSLLAIIDGSKKRVRARTEKAILAVTQSAAADHALVDGTSTWVLLNELLADGYSKAHIARGLGGAKPALQLRRDKVLVRTKAAVERLYEKLRFVDAQEMLDQMAELREEGYRQDRISAELRAMAQQLDIGAMPKFEPRRGRVHYQAARIVKAVYVKLTT